MLLTISKAVRSSKINPKIHFHSLRHTFASCLVQNGNNLYEVSKLLGHSNILVTETYSHIGNDVLLNSISKTSNYNLGLSFYLSFAF